MTRKKNGADSAILARGKFVSTLPDNHMPTIYARAKVCARCGQNWPCQSAVQGTGIALIDLETG